MNGSAAASNRAAAAAFSFGDEDATDNDRNRAPWLNLGKNFHLLFAIGNFSAWNFVEYRKAGEDSKKRITYQKEVWEGSDAALNTHKKEETCTLK
jgi:hypothetical protein